MKYLLIVVAISFVVIKSLGQDPFYFQNINAECYNNPAYSGLNRSFSFDLAHRNQWPNLSGNYITTVAAANQYLGKGNGVSALFLIDNAGDLMNKNEFDLGYSKSIMLRENHYLSLGLQIGYFSRHLNVDKLVFGQSIDPRRGYVYPIRPTNITTEKSNLDSHFGFLYHSNVFYTGFSVKHLLEPYDDFFSVESRLERLYFFEGGGKIKIGESWSLILYAQYRFQGNANAGKYGVKTKYKSVVLDLGLQNGDILYAGIGYYHDNFRLGYNIAAYTIWSNIYYSHEFSLSVDLNLFQKENDNFFDF